VLDQTAKRDNAIEQMDLSKAKDMQVYHEDMTGVDLKEEDKAKEKAECLEMLKVNDNIKSDANKDVEIFLEMDGLTSRIYLLM
jgi:hypothetical protein